MSASLPERVITEPLGGSKLSVAAQSGRLPAELFSAAPSDREEWASHVQRVRSTDARWYDAIREAIGARGKAATRLQRVAKERGVVITTGQQAALFGGPMYTLTKALSALALADEIEQQTGVATAAVFWAATDDADFLEASHTWVADADGLLELQLEQRPPAGTPMASAPLGPVEPLLTVLRKASGSAAHSMYLDAARSAYSEQRTIGDAYVRLLRDLLEPLGVAVLDSSHPAYLAAARPVLIDAARRAPGIAAALTQRDERIRALGFEPQVQVTAERGLSLVVATESGVKRRLKIDEARALDDREAPTLGANVLLRPVVERAILPTVAYVAGPAELAYFAQVGAVADVLGRDRPIAVPRWSCTVIESFVARALDRLGIAYRDTRDLHAVERKLAQSALPPEVTAAWETLQRALAKSLSALDETVRGSALLPAEVVQGLQRSIEHRLGRMERRLLAAAKRRDAQTQRDVALINAALYPLDKRQERVLNFIPILTRAGPDLVDEMRTAAGLHAKSLIGSTAPAAVR